VTFERRIERPYRVRFDEAGPDGYLRASGFLRFAQDLAWIHSESAGFGREWYRERRLLWLARAIELDVLAQVPYSHDLDVSTELIGFRRVFARRRSEFRPAGEERIIAVAITDWVMITEEGRPVRPPQEILEAFGSDFGGFTPLRMDPPIAPESASPREFRPRRSELDPMAHVNNAAYIDYMDEQFLGLERIRHGMPVPRRYQAEFLASAKAGAKVIGRGWSEDSAWLYQLWGDERELFRARLETDPSSWVGG
jgi:acyl-CoA thioesterase FadM